ncbi:MAG TPA: FKBP-type peptidyl-prolyl cis-trans isomerase [Solirubrobacterales bacterium]|nr:FKBP-type peptidyl-prolyl cis-trans isomerase [Solirubrobacterales bacterium]
MKRLALILVACLALLAAGCGGSDDDSTGTGETAAATEATTESSAPQEESKSGSGEGKSAGGEKTKPTVTVPSGPPPKKLEIEEIEKGTGATAKAGDEVTVQYVGVGYDSEEEFDSSWSRNEPFSFQLGAGMVIKGWDQGVAGMKVGGRRELIIPANLAYGPAGSPPAIGPNETLIFVIDLLAVQ